MSDTLTLEECSELEFTLLNIVQRAINMCMEWEVELDVHHTKINHAIFAQGN